MAVRGDSISPRNTARGSTGWLSSHSHIGLRRRCRSTPRPSPCTTSIRNQTAIKSEPRAPTSQEGGPERAKPHASSHSARPARPWSMKCSYRSRARSLDHSRRSRATSSDAKAARLSCSASLGDSRFQGTGWASDRSIESSSRSVARETSIRPEASRSRRFATSALFHSSIAATPCMAPVSASPSNVMSTPESASPRCCSSLRFWSLRATARRRAARSNRPTVRQKGVAPGSLTRPGRSSSRGRRPPATSPGGPPAARRWRRSSPAARGRGWPRACTGASPGP